MYYLVKPNHRATRIDTQKFLTVIQEYIFLKMITIQHQSLVRLEEYEDYIIADNKNSVNIVLAMPDLTVRITSLDECVSMLGAKYFSDGTSIYIQQVQKL